jgi:hypothetical protein
MDVSPEFWTFYQHAAAAAAAMAASQSSGGTNPSSSNSSGTSVPICTPTVVFNGASVPSASTASGSQCIDRTACSKNPSLTFHNNLFARRFVKPLKNHNTNHRATIRVRLRLRARRGPSSLPTFWNMKMSILLWKKCMRGTSLTHASKARLCITWCLARRRT